MLKTKTYWAAQIVLFLAIKRSTVLVSDIARETKISQVKVEQLINLLSKAGILVSVKHKKAGYRLRADATSITLQEILTAMGENAG